MFKYPSPFLYKFISHEIILKDILLCKKNLKQPLKISFVILYLIVFIWCCYSQITLLKWTEYLCDFLEMVGTDEFSSYLPTIRRGHYGLLDTNSKLGILRELVSRVIATDRSLLQTSLFPIDVV